MVLQGRADLPLSRRGWRQVELLRRRLRREPRFTAIYSSPLRRAGATAAALSGAGLGPLRFRPDLQEIDCGALDGAVISRHEGRIALVTHAGVIGQILGALAGTSPAQWESFRPGNTGLTEIEWANGRRMVLRHDDRRHLLDD